MPCSSGAVKPAASLDAPAPTSLASTRGAEPPSRCSTRKPAPSPRMVPSCVASNDFRVESESVPNALWARRFESVRISAPPHTHRSACPVAIKCAPRRRASEPEEQAVERAIPSIPSDSATSLTQPSSGSRQNASLSRRNPRLVPTIKKRRSSGTGSAAPESSSAWRAVSFVRAINFSRISAGHSPGSMAARSVRKLRSDGAGAIPVCFSSNVWKTSSIRSPDAVVHPMPTTLARLC